MKRLCAILTVLIAAAAMPNQSQAKTNCQNFFDKFQRAPGHKAFATSRGNDPGFHPTTCSFFSGFSFKKLAERKAVADCNHNSRPEDGGHCKVISSQ